MTQVIQFRIPFMTEIPAQEGKLSLDQLPEQLNRIFERYSNRPKLDWTEEVLKLKEPIQIQFTYPLTQTISLTLEPGEYSRAKLVQVIVEKYYQIYKECEFEGDSEDPGVKIWGHSLKNLSLDEIFLTQDPSVWELGISS